MDGLKSVARQKKLLYLCPEKIWPTVNFSPPARLKTTTSVLPADALDNCAT